MGRGERAGVQDWSLTSVYNAAADGAKAAKWPPSFEQARRPTKPPPLEWPPA